MVTPKQGDVLETIRSREQDGKGPTLSEIADAIGIHKASARDRIAGLVRKGLVEKTIDCWRERFRIAGKE